MKHVELKFEDYKFTVPSEKAITKKLEPLIEELKKCGSIKTALPIIKKWNKAMIDIYTNMSVIYVKYSCDTTNVAYQRAQDKSDEVSPIISKFNNDYMKIVTKALYRKDLEKLYGPYLLKMYDYQLKSFDEKIIPELIEENKLSSQYDKIRGGAKIEFRGETYNLSQMGKFVSDKDRNTRKEAAIACDKWWAEHETEIGELYDKLVRLRDEMAKKLGFKNFTDLGYLRLGRTDYSAKQVKGYRKQIADEVVPFAQKLYKEQIKNLGIKKPEYYDYLLVFADGNPKPAGDEEYLVGVAKQMYEDLGKEGGEFFNYMTRNHLMDLTARKGKAPGGYCTTFSKYGAPFIFSNFNGTEGDVNVLTHEGGHAFQAYLSSAIKVPEYQSPTLEACEIHSMSMEFFAYPYLEGFFGKDAEKYKYSHITDAIKFLPYGITIDEFQHWVYENPNASHEQRCAKYKEIENRYTPHKKYDDCPTLAKGGWWMKQGHVFGSPFYYIDYTLAQVVAFQFAAEMNKNHEKAWKKYVKLCKFGGKAPFQELLKVNKLRNPFEDGNVKKAIAPMKKLLKTVKL